MSEIFAMIEKIFAIVMEYLRGMFIPAEDPEVEA